MTVLALLSFAAFDIRAEDRAYPEGWPSWSGMATDCHEVFGTYVDPNVMQWDSERTTESGVKIQLGGRLDAAWWAFGIRPDGLELNRGSGVPRSFSLRRIDGDVVLDYFVDGRQSESLTIVQGKWFCAVEGMTMVTRERSGKVVSDVPGSGTTALTVTAYRIGRYLYVKSSSKADLRLFGLVPWREEDAKWYRFESLE